MTGRTKKNNPQKLTIDKKVITSSENVTLLGLEVDSKLNFDEHISKLCNKSAGQLTKCTLQNRTLIRIGREKNINKQLHLSKF